jgi:LL-diaminopimelate aminotransferase
LPIQDAAVVALTGDQSWLAGRNEIYRERRDLILGALRDMGIEAGAPVASLYIWARVPKSYTSAEFATRVLEEIGVSITPGSAFGPHGEGFTRISLGMSTERITEAMERLRGFEF